MVSCFDKTGLISNNGIESLDEEGIIGLIQKINPKVLFVSTGETYKLLKKNNFNALDITQYTKYPEMKSGLVKSMHPKIHAGILGHKYTPDDKDYLKKHNIRKIDLVITNFYDLESALELKKSIEDIRQAIDVGGPTMCHSARKSFINTAIVTSKDEYVQLQNEITKHNGSVSLEYRLEQAKIASNLLCKYFSAINSFFTNLCIDDLYKNYIIKE